jgi:hypothetical protein
MNAHIVFMTDHGVELSEMESEDLNELKQWLFEMAKDKYPCAGGIETDENDGFIICNGDLGKYRNA